MYEDLEEIIIDKPIEEASFLDRPDEWYHTSNIEKIDWEGRTFVTRNSVYTFEFINEESL